MRNLSNSGWVLTCFACGKKDHKVNSCPSWKVDQATHINGIVTPCETPPEMVKGLVGKIDTQMLLDTGANRSVVHSKFVTKYEYLGKHCKGQRVQGRS